MKVTIQYRIYSVDEKGMIERPQRWGEDKYGDFATMEAACEFLTKKESYQEYLILPITNINYEK